MTRQLSLWVLVLVIIASIFFAKLWQEDIQATAQITAEISIKDINRKTNITEIIGDHYVIRSFHLDPQIRPGDRIRVSGKRVDVRDASQRFYNESYANYLRSQKLYYTMTTNKIEKISTGMNFYTLRYHVREYLSGMIDAMYGKDAAMIKALTYGDKTDMEQEINQRFSVTGTSHVLALSGFHVGIIGMLLNVLLAHLPVKKRGALTMGILVIYSFITGLRASILRAVGFFALYYFSFALNRRYNLVAAAMLMMAFLLSVNPYYIYDMGFTLSFAGVFSIAFFYPMLKSLTHKLQIKENWLISLFMVTLSAQILTLPLTAYYFGILSFVSMLANIIVVPLIGFLMPLSLISIGVHLLGNILPIFDVVEMGLTGMVRLVQHIILGTVHILGNLPHSHMEGIALTPLQLFAVLGMLMAIYLYWEIKTIQENKYESQRIRKITADQS